MHNPTLNRRAFLAAATTTAAQTKPPNLVLILTDDLGLADLGCYGAKDIRPPAIDRLAAQGVRFTQCYSNGPLCSPTNALTANPTSGTASARSTCPATVPTFLPTAPSDSLSSRNPARSSFMLLSTPPLAVPNSSPAHRYFHWPHLV